MDDREYRAYLNLLMCCDPWPETTDEQSQEILDGFADKEAKKRGYDTWITAYHEFAP